MVKLLQLIQKNYKGTDVKAPFVKGLKTRNVHGIVGHCDCDCACESPGDF